MLHPYCSEVRNSQTSIHALHGVMLGNRAIFGFVLNSWIM